MIYSGLNGFSCMCSEENKSMSLYSWCSAATSPSSSSLLSTRWQKNRIFLSWYHIRSNVIPSVSLAPFKLYCFLIKNILCHKTICVCRDILFLRQNFHPALSRTSVKALTSQVYPQVRGHRFSEDLQPSFFWQWNTGRVSGFTYWKYPPFQEAYTFTSPALGCMQCVRWVLNVSFYELPQQCTLPHQTFRQGPNVKSGLPTAFLQPPWYSWV